MVALDMAEGHEQHPVVIRIHAGQEQRVLIDQAAGQVGRSREGFILEAASRRAAEVVLDKVFFPLNSRVFAEFQSLRDHPPAPGESLRRLLLTKVPWE